MYPKTFLVTTLVSLVTQFKLLPVLCSQCRIRKLWISLSVHLVCPTEAYSKIPGVILHRRQQGTAGIGWTVSARLLGAKRFFSMKRDPDSAQKIYEVLAARHLNFLKCSLLAKHIWSLLLLAKINALLACSQVLTKTIRYPSYAIARRDISVAVITHYRWITSFHIRNICFPFWFWRHEKVNSKWKWKLICEVINGKERNLKPKAQAHCNSNRTVKCKCNKKKNTNGNENARENAKGNENENKSGWAPSDSVGQSTGHSFNGCIWKFSSTLFKNKNTYIRKLAKKRSSERLLFYLSNLRRFWIAKLYGPSQESSRLLASSRADFYGTLLSNQGHFWGMI